MELLEISDNRAGGSDEIYVTERAARQVQTLLAREGKVESALRIRVLGGGCSGLKYNLSFDDQKKETDREWFLHGIRIRLDPASHKYLAGSTVDFEDGLNGTGFKIQNPKATGTCGCGESFSI